MHPKPLLTRPTTSSLPGFSRLRITKPNTQQASPGLNGSLAPVACAFVEFKDVHSAAAAMGALQGKFLLSSDRGAMRIEFAKSKMAPDLVQPCQQQLQQVQQMQQQQQMMFSQSAGAIYHH